MVNIVLLLDIKLKLKKKFFTFLCNKSRYIVTKNFIKNCRNFEILKPSLVFENFNYKTYRKLIPIQATPIDLGTAISGSSFFGQ